MRRYTLGRFLALSAAAVFLAMALLLMAANSVGPVVEHPVTPATGP